MRKQNNNLQSREGKEGKDGKERAREQKREQCEKSSAASDNTCYAVWFDLHQND